MKEIELGVFDKIFKPCFASINEQVHPFIAQKVKNNLMVITSVEKVIEQIVLGEELVW